MVIRSRIHPIGRKADVLRQVSNQGNPVPASSTPRKGANRSDKKRPTAKTRMGRLRESNTDTSSAFYQERRREIIEAAAQVFSERGFAATNFGMIAEKLGSDRASIYYYFGSKEDLFQEVVREVGQHAVETAERIAAGDGAAPEKLRAAFQAVLETYSSSYPYMHVFLQENLTAQATDEESWQAESLGWADRYYRAIRRILQQGMDEGSMQITLPVGVATMGVLGTVNWAYRWFRPGGKLSPAIIGDGFAQMLLDGIAVKRRTTAGRKTAAAAKAAPAARRTG
ncbi:MAG TPA: TetR/AcrR family transcriptional regulator [Ramlibacter sp.]|nr:TetR/AcrR family transcriptional regulator [Ramlibacter sp.]